MFHEQSADRASRELWPGEKGGDRLSVSPFAVLGRLEEKLFVVFIHSCKPDNCSSIAKETRPEGTLFLGSALRASEEAGRELVAAALAAFHLAVGPDKGS